MCKSHRPSCDHTSKTAKIYLLISVVFYSFLWLTMVWTTVVANCRSLTHHMQMNELEFN